MKDNVIRLSFANVILIVFVILKLAGLVDWSWLWVLSPFWIPFMIYVSAVGLQSFVKKY